MLNTIAAELRTTLECSKWFKPDSSRTFPSVAPWQIGRAKMTAIAPPPTRYDGRFSEFYERYVEPNLPSASKVQAFDLLLRRHLSGEDPVHVIRYVNGLTRGSVYRTGQGWRVLPTDNAPVWWTHALLHSGGALPEDSSELFEMMPCHFFEVARLRTLNQAGYHAAHILSAKNRDIDWQSWPRKELARRMLVNVHPCNFFLIAKPDWMRNGGRQDIIAWVVDAYLRRYGPTMERFLADTAGGNSVPCGPSDDPIYCYGASTIHSTMIASQRAAPRQNSPELDASTTRRTKRPIILRHLIGKGAVLDINVGDSRYVLPHDDLLMWVERNTTAMETASWREHGAYSWPRATLSMLRFLEAYKVWLSDFRG